MRIGNEVLVTFAGLLALGTARAELVDIAWAANGRFEHSAVVAPAQFVELCGKLAKGQTVVWSFTGAQPMDFNIHYHQGKQVVFPAKQSGVAALEGKLLAPLDQDYCWMWTNKTAAAVALTVRLQR
jgi:hypothetical protein